MVRSVPLLAIALLSSALLVSAPAAAQDPAELRYQVQPGDTLWALAHRFAVAATIIKSVNGLLSEELTLGQSLRIPGASAAALRPEATRSYSVQDGDTFSSIASAHGIGVNAVMRLNPGVSERGLRAGMDLVLPAGARSAPLRAAAPRAPARRLSRAQRRWVRRAEALGLGTNPAASAILAGALEPSWIRAAGRGDPPRTFRWPVRTGWFVRGFGSGRHGGHLAIDIMGQTGWDVIAADDGIVGYADDGIRGYGNMVLLLHPGGWATAYGHNSSMTVVPGERVRRGQRIARVGATGRASGPHVHFMWITNGGEYCDPLPLFRPYARHRSGQHVAVTRLSAEDGIPRSIRCRVRPARIDDSEDADLPVDGEDPSATAITPLPTPQAPR